MNNRIAFALALTALLATQAGAGLPTPRLVAVSDSEDGTTYTLRWADPSPTDLTEALTSAPFSVDASTVELGVFDPAIGIDSFVAGGLDPNDPSVVAYYVPSGEPSGSAAVALVAGALAGRGQRPLRDVIATSAPLDLLSASIAAPDVDGLAASGYRVEARTSCDAYGNSIHVRIAPEPPQGTVITISRQDGPGQSPVVIDVRKADDPMLQLVGVVDRQADELRRSGRTSFTYIAVATSTIGCWPTPPSWEWAKPCHPKKIVIGSDVVHAVCE